MQLNVRSVGDRALLVEVADYWQAQQIYQLVRARAAHDDLPAPVDVVPAARTVLLDGLAGPAALQAWSAALTTSELSGASEAMAQRAPDNCAEEGDVVVPVWYDGADLETVARAWDTTVEEVARLHQGTRFRVAFCGFAPGFAYCVGAPPLPAVPRRTEPRARVPAGAVALADVYCGIYPRALPGGWQLIGHTDAVVFDADREPPALLSPGDVLRFEAM